MRVLVVDDSAFMRRALTQMIESEPGLEVVGAARNGKEAVEKAKSLKPDVITLDVEMPEMNGLDALREIRRTCTDPKPAVIMCSSLTSEGSHEALKAMQFGAADFVAKDSSVQMTGLDDLRNELIKKIRAVGDHKSRHAVSSMGSRVAPPVSSSTKVPRTVSLQHKRFDLMLIGSSTGGPPVLEQILCALPADLPMPVVVAQHMPPLFTKSLSERLDQMCQITVMHGTDRHPLTAGTAYIIKGGMNGRIVRGVAGRYLLEVGPEPVDAVYKPSVSALFASAAKECGARTLGIVLTGMGDDGASGAEPLKREGATLIAQEEHTCVVYGMPKAIVDRGLADAAMVPNDIAALLSSLSGDSSRSAA